MITPPRRALLALPAAGCAAREAPGPDGLHARAALKGLRFGTAVTRRHLAEPDLAAALRAECGLLVPEYEQKWSITEPSRGRRSFAPVAEIARFAASAGMGMRGHTLLWHESEPRWLEGLDASATAAAVDQHIAVSMGQLRGRVGTWDVVNEAIHLADGRPDGLRRTRLLARLGVDHLARAFSLARQADPAARLAYNDYGCEHATFYGRQKRPQVLALLRRLRPAGLSVLGVQAHLDAGLPFEAAEWRAFLADVAALGLTIEVTELDVNDRALPAAPGPRDAAAAGLVRRFLDATLDERAVTSIVTWGLTDRHSWIRRGLLPAHRRDDGALARPLPFDDAMRRKPMWHAIAAALDAAPGRRSG